MYLPIKQKQTHSHREQTCACRKEVDGKDGLGVWGYQMQTIIHRIDKLQGLTG